MKNKLKGQIEALLQKGKRKEVEQLLQALESEFRQKAPDFIASIRAIIPAWKDKN